MKLNKCSIIILPLLCFFISNLNAQKSEIINLKHLDYLSRVVERNNEKILLTYIYCEYPDYKLVDAVGEGIACIDDVARAAIVYAKHFQYTGNKKSLQKVRYALNFILQLQAEDGSFYNFVYKDLSINRKGKTSCKSIGFWSARALWALSYGYSIFKDIDLKYSKRLQVSINKAIKATAGFMENNSDKKIVGNKEIPRWLIVRGADCWSIFLLGLCKFYKYDPDDTKKKLIVKIADGVANFQFGSFNQYPFAAHLSWGGNPYLWHGWANRQTQALCKAYQVIPKKKWLLSAKEEAVSFYTYLLSSQMLGSMKPEPVLYEQIAYTVSPIVEGCLGLANVTKEKEWSKLAGITASWFMGNNPHRVLMYDFSNGRCFDGLTSSNKVNFNSGAESTLEALMAIIDVEQNPIARKYLFAKPISFKPSYGISINPGKKRYQFVIHQGGKYLCYVYFKNMRKNAILNVSNKIVKVTKKSSYPKVCLIPDYFQFGSGVHKLILNIPESIEKIIFQPVVQSKILLNNNKYVILTRDCQEQQVLLLEDQKCYKIDSDLKWFKQ